MKYKVGQKVLIGINDKGNELIWTKNYDPKRQKREFEIIGYEDGTSNYYIVLMDSHLDLQPWKIDRKDIKDYFIKETCLGKYGFMVYERAIGFEKKPCKLCKIK